ncbi:hypothetical protein ACWF94_33960 [Streptomyces sp. NPDC055078]
MALATAGATALIQQMAVDGWTAARDRVTGFFTRGSADPDAVAADLETSRAELIEARGSQDEETQADVLAEWRTRMRRTLQADPGAAAELRALLHELSPPDSDPAPVPVQNTITGSTLHGPVIQTGTIGSISFGKPDD